MSFQGQAITPVPHHTRWVRRYGKDLYLTREQQKSSKPQE